jgi:hypothetical protein
MWRERRRKGWMSGMEIEGRLRRPPFYPLPSVLVKQAVKGAKRDTGPYVWLELLFLEDYRGRYKPRERREG